MGQEDIVKIISAREIEQLSGQTPEEPGQLQPHWLEGPFNGDRLDVGMVTVSPGGVTPPHVHIGGQVMIVTAGGGFVEVAGERHVIGPGDVVVCPPDELHTHGALDDTPLSHLTVTTGGYTFPEPAPEPDPDPAASDT
jgi:quercetin dioxygenase-like cupin family protein